MGRRVFTRQAAAVGAEVRAGPVVPVGPAPLRRGREAGALLLFAVGAYISLGLGSLRCDPDDPTLGGVDWVGPVGASMARLLVGSFGLVAWLLPLELGLVGLPLLRQRPNLATSLRVAGDLVVAIVLSALVHVALPSLLAFGRMPAGGSVGLVFGELMRGLFSTAGSFLIGVTVVGLILIGRSAFSFIDLCRGLHALAVRAAALGRRAFARVAAAWQKARALRLERQATLRAAAQPRIDAPSDEAIIAQLGEDDVDWAPIETTGTPPLAISAALRERAPTNVALFERTDHEQLAAPTPHSIAPVAVPAADAPAPDASAKEPETVAPPARPRRKSSGPTIVDTKKDQQLVRRAPGEPVRPPPVGFRLPDPALLVPPEPTITELDREKLLEHAERLTHTLANYGVVGRVEEIHPGPTVTTYELAPEAGTKVSKVAGLSDDLALGLSKKVRIIAPIPGKSRIGFELPNDERVPVNLRALIEDKRFSKLAERAPLPVVLGRDIVGAPFYADLASMPHVIVAGATGAGKSVGLNVMLSSLLFCRTPDELRFLMIDPKVVELAPFDGIPHMLLPVVTDMKQAATALRWAVDEMERRYQLFANAGTKNILTYNRWVDRVASGEVPAPAPAEVEALSASGEIVTVAATKHGSDGVRLPGRLPSIVLVVDEFADLMMQQGKDVEVSVARLAQKARAAGMHVVLATQRPSVDVITGMIKANFPTRIAYRVAQKVDSRTILDEQGAELLLGSGDMLVKMNGSNETRRVQCPFISEEEVAALGDYLRTQGTPEYHDAILRASDDEEADAVEDEPLDARFEEAVRIVADTQRCSTSWLQRKMTIGYNRAAKIVEMMEKRGFVGPPNGARDREVLIPPG